MTKTHNEILQKWIEFWHKRGSLIVQNIVNIDEPNAIISDIISPDKKKPNSKKVVSAEKFLKNKIITDEMKLNISTTVNGYKKGSKSWSGENIEKFNTFFFDIDLGDEKKNKMDLKEAYNLIEPYVEQFDFIVQTAHGFHLRILLPDGKYTINDKDQYLSDWKQKGFELEGVLKLTFDPACFRTVRLTRTPGSIHQKLPDPKLTTMKLIKGIELLFPVYETQKMIENIPIRSVLEALDIEYEDDRIYEDGRLTNGRKINIAGNYINDFSGKGRPVGSPFSFVKHRFLKYGNLDPHKFDTEALIKTYGFFTERFGILQSLRKYKTIATPQILEKVFLDSRFEGKDIQMLLTLIFYARQYFLIQLPYGNKISVPISDIIGTTGLSMEVSDFVSNIKQLNTKLDKFGIQIKNATIPIISSKLDKIDDTDRLLEYTILPLWYQKKEYRRAFYWTHYINAKSLEMKTKGKAFLFYMKLCSELLSIVRLTDWEISKKEVCKFFEDENFTRIKKKIEKTMNITQDFNFTTTGKFIKFQKV